MKKNLYTVLYVEDDRITREQGIEYLEGFFSFVHAAQDAIQALKIYKEHQPHVIITDIQMPKLNGLDFVREIRKIDQTTQVIILTAFSDTAYLLKAIELKLVKYLIKPINEKSFDAAIEMCLENLQKETHNIITFGQNSYFDTFNNTLVIEEKIITLRTKEVALLTLLLKNRNRFVSYLEIEHAVWQESAMSKDALKTVVKNLKAKLPKESIVNLTGTGYKFVS